MEKLSIFKGLVFLSVIEIINNPAKKGYSNEFIGEDRRLCTKENSCHERKFSFCKDYFFGRVSDTSDTATLCLTKANEGNLTAPLILMGL